MHVLIYGHCKQPGDVFGDSSSPRLSVLSAQRSIHLEGKFKISSYLLNVLNSDLSSVSLRGNKVCDLASLVT